MHFVTMWAWNTFTAKVFLELPPAVKNLFLLTDKVQRRKFFHPINKKKSNVMQKCFFNCHRLLKGIYAPYIWFDILKVAFCIAEVATGFNISKSCIVCKEVAKRLNFVTLYNLFLLLTLPSLLKADKLYCRLLQYECIEKDIWGWREGKVRAGRR